MTNNYGRENKALLKAIQTVSEKHDISYELLSGDWVVKLTKGNQSHFINGHEFDVNNQASADIALDKVATYQLLAENNIAAIPHFLLSTESSANIDKKYLNKLFKEFGELVIKPVNGRNGNLVAKFNDIDAALIYMKKSSEHAWAASPHTDIAQEIRIVVSNGSIKLIYEKTRPSKQNGLKIYNLSRGAIPRKLNEETLDRYVKDMAVQSMRSIGLKLGAVDVVLNAEGYFCVLEINSGFTLEHYAQYSSANNKEVITFYVQTIKNAFGL